MKEKIEFVLKSKMRGESICTVSWAHLCKSWEEKTKQTKKTKPYRSQIAATIKI